MSRKRWVFAVPAVVAVVVWAAWLGMLGPQEAVATMVEQWPVALTMVFGSFVAGASSEGGGAVAFPVFTKLLHVAPANAKLFALMIQSLGMSAAAITILALRIRIDRAAVAWASLGGVVGIAISLAAIAPVAPPPHVRVVFTAMQASFAAVLALTILRDDPREKYADLHTWEKRAGIVWAGMMGGIVSGLVGSGLDLIIFALLTLRFRVSEKVATPTSVVVMAINSLFAVGFYRLAIGGIPSEVTGMWLGAAPIVVVGAPLGAWFCSKLRRETIAWMLIGLIGIEVATTIWLVPQTKSTMITGASVAIPSIYVCFLMAQRGSRDAT